MEIFINVAFWRAEADCTSGLTEVLTPRKFRPREDFPSNRSSELENPNRAGEIFRDGAKFGRRKMRRRPLE
jgi:hypothetical protein